MGGLRILDGARICLFPSGSNRAAWFLNVSWVPELILLQNQLFVRQLLLLGFCKQACAVLRVRPLLVFCEKLKRKNGWAGKRLRGYARCLSVCVPRLASLWTVPYFAHRCGVCTLRRVSLVKVPSAGARPICLHAPSGISRGRVRRRVLHGGAGARPGPARSRRSHGPGHLGSRGEQRDNRGLPGEEGERRLRAVFYHEPGVDIVSRPVPSLVLDPRTVVCAARSMWFRVYCRGRRSLWGQAIDSLGWLLAEVFKMT